MNSVRYEQVSTSDWNIKNNYNVGTRVYYDGSYYVSKKNVPSGVNIGMSDYWKKLTLADDIDNLADEIDDVSNTVDDIKNNLVVTVSEEDIPFKFAYDSENGIYGFMVGEVFHPFGGEVINE